MTTKLTATATDGCPVCGHEKSDHGRDGCLDGWEYGGPDGMATVEGCYCRITGWTS